MTIENVEKLNLGISPVDNKVCLMVESALLWVKDNTILNIDIDDVPSNLSGNIKLFILKYIEVMSMTAGVTGENIEGLSQSFDTADKGYLLRQYAGELLGEYGFSDLKMYNAKTKWR